MRRWPLIGLLVAAVAGATWVGAGAEGSARAAATAAPVWQAVPPDEPRAIEGYASTTSVAPGATLELRAGTTPGARYRIELVRIGWYGGAGGKRIACVPADCTTSLDGDPREMPGPDANTGEVRVDWPVTDRIAIPRSWRSGYYLAKLVLTEGPDVGRAAAVPFVVRRAATARPKILVVAPVNTWQEYNAWGGLNTYTDKVAAVRVSFDRPYAHGLNKLTLDYPIIRFLDQFGYDVGYVTDVDIDRDPSLLRRTRLVVFGAHSEYWTKRMRTGAEAARDAGVNLAFLGGNSVYWQTRYVDARRRALWQWRSATLDPMQDPTLETVRWRDAPVNLHECQLLGVQWQGGDNTTGPGPRPYTVVASSLSHPWFKGTGFKAGSRVKGAVGYEWDAVAPECTQAGLRVQVLFHSEGRATPLRPGFYKSTFHSTDADFVTYRAPSGARVLSVGSIDFGWTVTGAANGAPVAAGITDPETPPDRRMQRFLRNAFADLTR